MNSLFIVAIFIFVFVLLGQLLFAFRQKERRMQQLIRMFYYSMYLTVVAVLFNIIFYSIFV
jgi:heme/copper-type cytochrome/quinol oxidase subunit 2